MAGLMGAGLVSISKVFRAVTETILAPDGLAAAAGAAEAAPSPAVTPSQLINHPDRVVDECIDGLVAASPHLRRLAGHRVVLRDDIEDHRKEHVTLVCGGGSGHEPAHAGYVGGGMLSAAVCGNVFASPPVSAIFAAIMAVAGPPGVLVIVKNYTGDRLNFGIAGQSDNISPLKKALGPSEPQNSRSHKVHNCHQNSAAAAATIMVALQLSWRLS